MPSNEVVARRGQAARARSGAAARRGAAAVKQQAAAAVAEVSRDLRAKGERFLAEQKLRAAGGLQDIGQSIQEAASRLTEGPLEPVGPYVEAAAERVSRASDYLAEHEVADLLRDAERAVLSRPQLFLGGMFLTGLLAARFLKATAPPAARTRADENQARSRQPQRAQR
jgi:hypothetical protein